MSRAATATPHTRRSEDLRGLLCAARDMHTREASPRPSCPSDLACNVSPRDISARFLSQSRCWSAQRRLSHNHSAEGYHTPSASLFPVSKHTRTPEKWKMRPSTLKISVVPAWVGLRPTIASQTTAYVSRMLCAGDGVQATPCSGTGRA